MLRISIVIPNLQVGGAERVAINLANSWADLGHQVEFVLMERRGEFLETVDPAISIHTLGCTRFRQVPWRLSRYLRHRQPDVTLVHMWPLTSIGVLAWWLAGKPGKLFVCEHTNISYHVRADMSTPLFVVQMVLRLSHQNATAVVAVSLGAAKDLSRLACMAENRIEVIYNPVVDSEPPDLTQHSNSLVRATLWRGDFRTHLLAVGNLKASKNYRLLLQSLAMVVDDLDPALVILGEGVMRSTLQQDVQDLGLQDRVVIPGFQPNPTPWYQAADLFVLSSDFEGFANVVVEALACGIPVVSTDCPHGPAEILEYGRYGELVLVDDAYALAAGIRRAADRIWDPKVLQKRALDFSIPRKAQAYLDLFYRD